MTSPEVLQPSPTKRNYVFAFLWSATERIGQTLFLLLGTIVIARVSGPADFGVASLAIGLIFIAETSADRLFRDVIVQREKLNEREVGSAFSTAILLSAIATIAMALAAPSLAVLFTIPALAQYLVAGCLSILFTGSGGVLAALLHRRMEFGKLARRTLLGSIVGASVGLTMISLGYGAFSLIGMYLAQSFAALVAVATSIDRVPRLRWHFRSIAPLVRFALPVTVSEIIWNSSFRIVAVIVGYLVGPAAVGILEISMRVVQSVRNLWQASVAPVALSFLVARRRSIDGFREAYRRLTSLGAAAILPVFGGIAAVARDLVALALGPEWAPAVQVMQILAVAAGVSVLMQFSGVTLNAVGRPGWNVLSASISLVAAIVGIVVIGVTTAAQAAIVWTCRLLFSHPVIAWGVWRSAGLRPWRELIAPVVPSAVATLTMVATTQWINATFFAAMPAAGRLPLTIAIGVLSYCASLFVLSPTLIGQLRSLLMEIPSGRGR